jgi:hypothetical protein
MRSAQHRAPGRGSRRARDLAGVLPPYGLAVNIGRDADGLVIAGRGRPA